MPRRSRPRRPSASLVAAAALVFGVTACADTTQLPPAPDTGTETPALFASDEEALAAATAAYEEYLAASRTASESGGVETAELQQSTSAEMFDLEATSLELLRENEWRTAGQSEIVSLQLQQWFADADGVVVILNVCLDVADVSVLDAQGNDVTPSDRQDRLPLQIETVGPLADGGLVVSGSDVLADGTGC